MCCVLKENSHKYDASEHFLESTCFKISSHVDHIGDQKMHARVTEIEKGFIWAIGFIFYVRLAFLKRLKLFRISMYNIDSKMPIQIQ
jgi:hypothetical protein